MRNKEHKESSPLRLQGVAKGPTEHILQDTSGVNVSPVVNPQSWLAPRASTSFMQLVNV